MYQSIASYFALSLIIYLSSKSFQILDESICGNSSIKTIFINYVSFTSNIYLLTLFIKCIK